MKTRSKSAAKKARAKPAAAPAKAAVPRTGSTRRVKLPDAMRALGLDESKLAGKLDGMIERLDDKNAKASTADKMLLEVLKECGKLLEAYPAARGGGADAVPVELVHFVSRPARAAGPTAAPPAAGDDPAI